VEKKKAGPGPTQRKPDNKGGNNTMRLTITGVHMDTGNALREHTEAKVLDLKQYFDQVLDADVTFVHEPHHHHLHLAEVTVHASGLMLRAEGQGVDFYGAVDDATGKLKRQLEKYKGRLEKRLRVAKEKRGASNVLAFEEAAVHDGAADEVAGVDGLFSEFAPEIVKKEVSRVAPMTVDEAVMQMDLLHKPAFLFMNVATSELNMVYREGGNTVRWVAPKAA
jgi:putative sigma-54 modulation protein